MSILSLKWSDFPPPEFCRGAVTVGNFDGVHQGHTALVSTARKWAKSISGPTVAVTFDPPPMALLRPGILPLPLTTLAERLQLLRNVGADRVIVLKTDASLLALSAEAFFEDVLLRQLEAKAVIEGYNFHFGRARGGNTRTLKSLCEAASIAFEELPPLLVDYEPVSSSRVRNEIQRGDVAAVARLLNRPYSITGTVVAGARRGRTIGFPTANLEEVETLIPAVGVYAVRAIPNGRPYAAAANIGPNPTFGENARKIEVHLLDFDGDLYGQTVRVEFVERLRDTKPFVNVNALIEQLQNDVVQARRLCSLVGL
jgi:riboflavin kinase / FMN adenylyltransferase